MVWYNPNYQHPDRPTPPAETGRRLATFPRGDSAELRLTLAEYEGRPYLALRVWERDDQGRWWPVKGKGCSIRLGEVDGLIAALRQVEDMLDRQDGPRTPHGPRQHARTAATARRPSDADDGTTGRVGDLAAGPDDHPRYVDRRRRREPRRVDPGDLDRGPARRDFDECGDDR